MNHTGPLAFVAVGMIGAASSAVISAAPASAATCSGPDGAHTRYAISDRSAHYYPTNVRSDWVYPKYGSASISYDHTRTATVTASLSSTVSASADAVFLSASQSIGVTVGGSWAISDSWNYTMNVAKDKTHKYRLHLYHYTYDFTVTRYNWICSSGRTGWVKAANFPQRIHHAPVGRDRNLWRLDRSEA